MLDTLDWLALEVKYLDRSQAFYEAFLDLDVRGTKAGEVHLDAGETTLILREPGTVPRGGVHTHYAFSIPRGEYDSWWDRLDERFDLVEHTFGDARSLYFYDPDGHCVELGQSGIEGPGISDVFEVVLEVEDLERALAFYRELGFEVVDRGDDRRRVRLTAGSFDIELWEPQLGLADAQGGLHVDLGVTVAEPEALATAVSDQAMQVEEVEGKSRLRDPDGHYVTLLGE